MFFQNFESLLEVWTTKGEFSDNPGDTILEFYNVLLQLRLPISKNKLNIKYNKVSIRVALQVAIVTIITRITVLSKYLECFYLNN